MLLHLGLQRDRFTGNHEIAVATMMNCPRLLHCRVDPGLDDLKNKESIQCHQTGVGHPAFEIGIAFVDERCGDVHRRFGRQAEGCELVDLCP